MNVVVGKSLGPRDAVFIDRMEYVIFRPTGTRREHHCERDRPARAARRHVLERENLEIVASGDEDAPSLPAPPRTWPGPVRPALPPPEAGPPTNSLGLAKFIFPNSENVYMHGTPAQGSSRARAAT